jgi:hypothetical protein
LVEIVVADAGPLIAFGRLDKFSVLGAVFDRVIVPEADDGRPRTRGSPLARADLPLGEFIDRLAALGIPVVRYHPDELSRSRVSESPERG